MVVALQIHGCMVLAIALAADKGCVARSWWGGNKSGPCLHVGFVDAWNPLSVSWSIFLNVWNVLKGRDWIEIDIWETRIEDVRSRKREIRRRVVLWEIDIVRARLHFEGIIFGCLNSGFGVLGLAVAVQQPLSSKGTATEGLTARIGSFSSMGSFMLCKIELTRMPGIAVFEAALERFSVFVSTAGTHWSRGLTVIFIEMLARLRCRVVNLDRGVLSEVLIIDHYLVEVEVGVALHVCRE